jgi:hypothetical protein
MNKHLILQEAFALDLPEKIKKVSKQVILAKVTLAEELDVYSNDLENGDNKQGVSERKQYNKVREYANSPIVFAETNCSKQKSIAEYDNLQGWLLSKFQDIISMQ